MPKRYDWPRFLVDRDGVIVLDDQDFLADATIDFGEIINPHAKAFSDLPDLPVIVFLSRKSGRQLSSMLSNISITCPFGTSWH